MDDIASENIRNNTNICENIPEECERDLDYDQNENICTYESDNDIENASLSPPNESRYPSRERHQPPHWFMALSVQCVEIIKVTTGDQPTLRGALSATQEDKSLWESALDFEFESLESKKIWVRDNNPRAQPLPTHTVLKVKLNGDCVVERFKARIVGGGNFEMYGVDYMDTYAPVVSLPVVRIFLYLVLSINMSVAQLDIKTAVLNGELEEDV